MGSPIVGGFVEAAKQVGGAFGQAFKDGQSGVDVSAPQIHIDMKGDQASSLIALACPKCGASIQQQEGRDVAYCSYCGTKLLVDDGSAKVTYRTVDEARIRELEIEQEREHRRAELEERRRPGRVKLSIVLGGAGFLMMLVGWFAAYSSGDSDSPWYLVTMIGMLFLIVVPLIWLMAMPNANDEDGKRRH